MSIEIIHPGESSISVVRSAADEEIPIRRSPHVGNVNSNELQLIFGAAEMGATMQLEMVDSIQGDDNYSSPRHIMVGGASIPIMSKKQAKRRIVGACSVGEEGEKNCINVGIDDVQAGDSVHALHQDALEVVLPPNVSQQTSTEYFTSVGDQVLAMIIAAAQQHVDRPMRHVMADGSIKQLPEIHDPGNIFGTGDNPQEGALLPLEAMMAVELIDSAMNDADKSTVIHVAGPDMIRYTKCNEVMKPVKSITQSVLAACGVTISGNGITYVLPCMQQILHASEFPRVISEADVASQHDIVARRLESVGV